MILALLQSSHALDRYVATLRSDGQFQTPRLPDDIGISLLVSENHRVFSG